MTISFMEKPSLKGKVKKGADTVNISIPFSPEMGKKNRPGGGGFSLFSHIALRFFSAAF